MSSFNYLDKVVDAVIRIENNHDIKFFNEPGLSWFGKSKPETLKDFIYSDDIHILEKCLSLKEADNTCELRVNKEPLAWVNVTVIPMIGKDTYTLAIQDISRWKNTTIDKLIHASEHDVLTGLANRGLLEKVVNLCLTQYQYTGQKFALLLLDLDGFKKVNDSLGHNIGDEVIIATANRLTSIVRSTDLVSRLGGDEFVILLAGAHDTITVAAVASKVLKALSTPYKVTTQDTLYLSTSIGIAQFPEHGDDFHTVLKNADIAMYQAKGTGKNKYKFYTAENEENHTLSLETAMYDGIHEGEFQLLYQPKYNIHTRKMVGAEALMRWNSNDFGSVSPEHFIPLAETNGLISYLGTWALRSACHQLVKFQKIDPDFVMAVNVSGVQFSADNFCKVVETTFKETGIDPRRVILEITETTMMVSTEATNKKLKELKRLGINFSIDDFGSGFSSLSYLKKFPISELKIDKSFVTQVATDVSDMAIIKAIVAITKTLNLTCIAEGVETEEQLEVLKSLGCSYVQGYLLSKPLTVEEFTIKLKEELEQ